MSGCAGNNLELGVTCVGKIKPLFCTWVSCMGACGGGKNSSFNHEWIMTVAINLR